MTSGASSFPTLIDETARLGSASDLAALARRAEGAVGVELTALRSGDVVLVRTAHSLYTLRLRDPDKGVAIAAGTGQFLNEEVPGLVVGATLARRRGPVVTGRILVGWKLVLRCKEGELLTSRVQAISVNGMPWMRGWRSE